MSSSPLVVEISRRKTRLRRAIQYRFRIVAPNGRVLAVSSESYANLEDARYAVELVVGAPVAAKLGEQAIRR